MGDGIGEVTGLDPDAIRRLADEVSEAFEAGDVRRIGELYAEDVVVWHNYDGRERTRTEALESAAWVAREMADFRVTEVRLVLAGDGYVQQCVFRATDRATGRVRTIPAMIRFYCAGGRITRIEEYTDSAHGSVPD
jgi:ketosteroid isomerase-like protein